MYIYKAEKEAGLEDVISAHTSLVYNARAFSYELTQEELTRNIRCIHQDPNSIWSQNKAKSTKSCGQIDLYCIKDIMVSTGWNLNDDVFDLEEVWSARHTPEDKQFNFEHKQEDIIGHITGCYVIDEAAKIVPDETSPDELPSRFHIVNSTVLYKFWDVPELQERMNKIIAGIQDNKWYVSMECLFKNFDYAIMDAKGDTTIIPRNRLTAYLSKHLKVFGGTGKFENQRIGRLLRKLVFSGKGLVSNPANPESIIFSKSEAIFKDVGYKVISNNSDRSEVMATEDKTAQLEAQIKLLSEQNTKLEASLKDLDSKTVSAKIASLEADLKAKTEASVSFETKIIELSKAVDTAKAETKTVSEKLVEAEKKLADDAAKAKKADRVKTYASKLDIKEDVAELAVNSLVILSDEAFTAHVEHLVATLSAKQSTPAVAAPATNAVDIIASIQKNHDIALATANEVTSNIQSDIAKYLGKSEEK